MTERMQRRGLIAFLGGAAAWPLTARAQPTSAVKRIAILMGLSESDAEGQARIATFRQGLRQLGWTDGANARLEHHWNASGNTRSQELAHEVIRKSPDVILTNSPTALAAVKQATRTIPVVFVQVADPVSDGFVASLARPGGNITGFAVSEHAISGKWLEALKEIAPQTNRVGFIQHLEHPSWPRYSQAIQELAPIVGFSAVPIGVRTLPDLDQGITKLAQQPHGALLVLPDTFTSANRKVIIASATRHSLPTISGNRAFARDGGLMSYGGDLVDLLRQAASYVDRILRGANPRDLPVQLATRFELVLNLKTAKALGLAVPPILLVRADEVIE